MQPDRTDHLSTSLVFGAVGALLSAGAVTAWLDRRDALRDAAEEAYAEVAAPAPARPTAPEGARNVVFVVWDTVRADRMGLYGGPRPTTPRLDAWAASATVWDDAISPSFWTVPGHASLFTGLPVRVHQADAASPWLRDAHVTLAEHLRDHGWATYAFTSNPNIGPGTNLDQGFERLESQSDDAWAARTLEVLAPRLIPTDASTARSPAWPADPEEPAAAARATKDAGPVAAEALFRWLDDREDERPFFALLNYMEVHAPRLPSMEARRAVGLTDGEIALGLATPVGFEELKAANRGEREYTPAEDAAMLGVYDAAVWELDRTTGDLLDALAARGLADDTVIVIVSDHGDNLGEHGHYGHNWSVYDTLVRVPLVVKAPGLPPGRRPGPTSTADVFGGIAALAGAPLPSATTLTAPRAPVVAELTAPHGIRPGAPEKSADGRVIPQRRRFVAIYDGPWKLIRSSAGERELYDRAADPGELRDLAAREPERLAAMEAALDAWLAANPPPPDAPLPEGERERRRAGRVPRGDELREQLEALGYAQ